MGHPTRRSLELVAAWGALGSGAVHGLLVPGHVAEWWGYGVFFAVASLVQAVFAVALLTHAANPRDTGHGWERIRRAVYVVGLVGTIGLVALYAASRTTGVPFFGPEAGEVEDVAAVDLVAKGFELATIVCLILLLRRPLRDPGEGDGERLPRPG